MVRFVATRVVSARPWTGVGPGNFLAAYPRYSLDFQKPHVAHNAWLQELPDPVTKAVWDNYASLAPATAERLSLKNGDVVRLEASETAIELPVLIQPGQHEQVVAVALGYGRSVSARFAGAGPNGHGNAVMRTGRFLWSKTR